jgi:hypothetical protein
MSPSRQRRTGGARLEQPRVIQYDKSSGHFKLIVGVADGDFGDPCPAVAGTVHRHPGYQREAEPSDARGVRRQRQHGAVRVA